MNRHPRNVSQNSGAKCWRKNQLQMCTGESWPKTSWWHCTTEPSAVCFGSNLVACICGWLLTVLTVLTVWLYWLFWLYGLLCHLSCIWIFLGGSCIGKHTICEGGVFSVRICFVLFFSPFFDLAFGFWLHTFKVRSRLILNVINLKLILIYY